MQLRVSKVIQFFEGMLREKFGFEEYISIDKPTLFFGLYKDNDFKELQRHRGKKIAWFAGTDVLRLLTAVKAGKQNAQELLKDATVVAESPWIEKDLKELGIDYVPISLFIDDIYSWHSEPLGESLYWYGANTTKHGKRYVKEIRKAFPDLDIITNDRLTVPHSMMPKIYKKCFAGVRMIDHDGMSQTVGEMGLMGRMSIWNGNGPMAVPYSDVGDVIMTIKDLRRGFNHKLVTKRTRGFFIENEAKFTNLVLDLCGTSESDYLPIFDESLGRCGSIFRIQRTSDIKKIGGLGEDQFERPWFSNQMNKINKKQLLVSKNSGYAAGEWKNADGNKGYPKGFKDYNTHDRGTR